MTDVETKVDLETRDAHASLKDLDRKKERAVRRAQAQVWNRARGRAAAVVGAVVGFRSIGAIIRQHAGSVDPWAAAFIPAQAAIQQFIDDDVVGHSATATRRAVETTKRQLAVQVGRTSNLTAVEPLYSRSNIIAQQQESGRNIVQQAILGPSFDELVFQSAEGFVVLVEKSFGYIADGLR